MAVCAGRPSITRNYIGKRAYDLRYRTGFSNGRGVHSGTRSFEFNRAFFDTCSSWIRYTEVYHVQLVRGTGWDLTWVGTNGVGVCKSGWHGHGRAFDLSRLQYGTRYMDSNWSWRDTRSNQRRYLAVVAGLRMRFITVLTCWYNSSHRDHIHVDDGGGDPVPALRTGTRSDATLIQATCNILNGESLTIDGAWGSLTQAAYLRLLSKFNLSCTNPKSSSAAFKNMLSYIARTGWRNVNAGYYRSSCC